MVCFLQVALLVGAPGWRTAPIRNLTGVWLLPRNGSVVAAGVASLKLLINFETEAAVVHAVAEDAGEVEKKRPKRSSPDPKSCCRLKPSWRLSAPTA